MRVSKNYFTSACLFTLFCFVLSCAPKVISFKAEPRNICVGQQTTVSWEVEGLGILTAEPTMSNIGAVPEKGSKIFTPIDETNFQIIAVRNGKQTRRQNQYVYVLCDGDELPPIGGTAKLVGNSLVATIEHQFQEWGKIKVKNLMNPYERSLWVVYKGKEIELPAEPENCDVISNKPDYCQEFIIANIDKIFIKLNNDEINDVNLQPSILQTSGKVICDYNGE